MDIAVGVDVTKARSDRLIDEEQVGKLIPRTFVVL